MLGGFSSLNIDDKLVDRSRQWLIQWERLQRWKVRVDEVRRKCEESEQDFHDVVDTSVAFLQNCYHLRDWLVASDPTLKVAVDRLFRNSFELRCCRDVCNGFKHKKLTSPSVDPEPAIRRSYDPFAKILRPGKPSTIYKIYLANDKELLDCDLFDYVDRCFHEWLSFLKETKLLS